ncbi:hypothetical protein ABEB36_002626 [Hypothenemus hampei]|uniref:PIG-P domain-containing protein n=1 Tax=Hypothenemus hampei TaxID=57062 RepID=A0ABD1F733_HYPHA
MPEHSPAPTSSRAVYGFAMFLSFNIFFFLYLIWAIVPDTYFKQIGIDFLPQRRCAIWIPMGIIISLVVFAVFIYPSLGLLMTPNLNDLRTITDSIGTRRKKNGMKLEPAKTSKWQCVCKNEEKCWKDYYKIGKSVLLNKRLPSVRDLHVWDVSEQLYL